MHGQGLMVPVVGKLSLVDGEDGRPQHLLLWPKTAHGHCRELTCSPSGRLARMAGGR